jgi:hypothetical protein
MRLGTIRLAFAALLAALSFGAAAQTMPDFQKLEAQVHIRPEQKAQFDVAVAATRRALLSVGLASMQMEQDLRDEIAKPSPDFRALSRKSQQMIDDTRPLFVEAGREWQKLYAILDPKQLDAVRQFLRENGGSLLAPAK